MKLEDKVSQLTDLMADLIPTVDRLSKTVESIQPVQQLLTDLIPTIGQLSKTVEEIQQTQQKASIEFYETRISNMKLAEAIENLSHKIEKTSDIEKRIDRIEKTLFK